VPDIQAAKIGMADALRLELTFVYRWSNALVEEYGGGADPEEIHVPARLHDCVELLRSISQLVGQAEGAEKELPHWHTLDRQQLATSLRKVSPREARSRVLALHYGSPLSLQAYLTLGPAGLALLLYGVKRLFGYDLELMTHREKRRAEYLEARQLVKELEHAEETEQALNPEGMIVAMDDPEGTVLIGGKLHKPAWEPQRGVLRDESE